MAYSGEICDASSPVELYSTMNRCARRASSVMAAADSRRVRMISLRIVASTCARRDASDPRPLK